VLDWIAGALERPLVIVEPFRRLDAIVVLGAPLAPGDRLTAVLDERVRAAAELWRTGGAPIVVATGGVTAGARRAEADVIAEALRDHGVPDDAIVVEAASRSTIENARFTVDQIGRDHAVWLVTQPFHGRRAARAFRAAGLVPHVWHIADSLQYRHRGRAVRWLVREYVAWGRELLGPKR